jgi:hypothetical protein
MVLEAEDGITQCSKALQAVIVKVRYDHDFRQFLAIFANFRRFSPIFGDFHQFSAIFTNFRRKNWRFFLKTSVTINFFLHTLANKPAIFRVIIFLNYNIDPRYRQIAENCDHNIDPRYRQIVDHRANHFLE